MYQKVQGVCTFVLCSLITPFCLSRNKSYGGVLAFDGLADRCVST